MTRRLDTPTLVRIFVIAVCVIVTVVLTHLYMMYGTDKVAVKTGYLLALGVAPLSLGFLIGLVGAFVVARLRGGALVSQWIIPVFSSVSALLPIGWTLLMMS